MPPVSERQRRAMYAAAEGKSKLGIPKAVGEEFVGDAQTPIAAGVALVAPDGDILFLHRSKTEKNFGGHWGFPGGKGDPGELAEDAAVRETKEETGYDLDPKSLRLVDRVRTPNGMIFSTFAAPVPKKFYPAMRDGEHSGFTWTPPGNLPQPTHPQVVRVLGEHLGAAEDMLPEEWDELRETFTKWTREEEAEPEHAGDEESPEPDDRFAVGEGDFVIEQPANAKPAPEPEEDDLEEIDEADAPAVTATLNIREG